MITFSKLGSYGRLGNQLFQVAALIEFSKKYKCDFVIPEWKYSSYFKKDFKQQALIVDMLIEEKYYHYTPEFWDQYAELFKTKNVDLAGYFQSPKYWQQSKSEIVNSFTFKTEYVQRLKSKFERVFEKSTIAIHIRRGDFIANPNYTLLPLSYQIRALLKYFPDYKNYNLLFFSDDIVYCMSHIRQFQNVFFSKGQSEIEDLCLMTLCDHFIISNSTFSWWGALLAERKGTKVVRPAYFVSGELEKKIDWKDLYPDNWIKFDHKLNNLQTSRFELGSIKKNLYEFYCKFLVRAWKMKL